MSNPLTANQPAQQRQQNAPDLNALYQQFRKNPLEWLLKSKLNIPQELSGSPQAIVEHLYRTGQIPKQIMPQVQQMINKR